MTFSEWQQLAPADVARVVHHKASLLPPAQRAAVFAVLSDAADIEQRLTQKQKLASSASADSEGRDGPLGRPVGHPPTENATPAGQPFVINTSASAPRSSLLSGIPFVVKDVFDAAGIPTLAGSTFLEDERPRPSADGALVARMRDFGAVFVGKTHLHEFAYGITGENPHYGDVEHPHLPGRTSGGSSSGSAAAVAAGIVPLAFGTDTAGSIRVPAAFCGLHGFRMAPHHPWIADAFPLAPSFDTAGWFTGNAADMATSLRTLLGIHSTARTPRGRFFAFGDVDPALAEAQAHAAASLGARLESSLAEPLRTAFAEAPAAFGSLRAPEAWSVHAAWAERRRGSYDPVVFSRVIAGRDVSAEGQESGKKARGRLLAAFDAIWEEYDFLILPATPCVAPTKADCTQATRDRIFQLTTPVSLAGLPVLTLPIGLPGGFSTGLQIVAPSADSAVFADVLASYL